MMLLKVQHVIKQDWVKCRIWVHSDACPSFPAKKQGLSVSQSLMWVHYLFSALLGTDIIMLLAAAS